MKILENDTRYLNDFIALNEQWISKYFKLESVDLELAKNPEKIISDGGFIFAIMVKGSIVGVCALFKRGDRDYELARMAVAPDYQERGYGSVLMEHCLKRLTELGAKRVYLVSNTVLLSAIKLYRKYGFLTVHEGPHPLYNRANIVMERAVF